MDEALVPSTQRLRIGRSNFRLPLDIESKESTLQLVYDVLRRCPFFKAFLVTADVPKIYMQEFLATANVHQHFIRFKMDNKKHILDLESFRNMFLGHSATIRTLTDVNINKLYQPWRSFAAIINKCLTGKSSSYDSFWLSQAQILWDKRNIDYAFLIWEDFVYQVEHKNHKKSNEMYYLGFTKVIMHHFMSKDPFILRRNKVNWHYARDDFLFSTIKVVSKHQNTQQYGAMLPIELMNDEIRNTNAYKEYYAFATGEGAPKPKASVRRKMSGSDTSITPPTVAVTPKLIAVAKGKQPAKATKAKSPSSPSEVAKTEAQQLKIVLKRSRKQTHISQPGGFGTDEGTSSKPGVPDVPTNESGEELSWNSSDDEGEEDDDEEDKDGDERDDDEEDQEVAKFDDKDDTEKSGDDNEEGSSDKEDNNEEIKDEESFDPIPQTPESSEDKGDGEEDQGLNIGEEERLNEEEEADELYRDVNINQGRGLQVNQEVEDSHVILTLINSDVRRLREEAQKENDEFLRTVDENIKKIIKEQVKDQVKAQVSKILPRIEQAVNEQLETEVLTRSSHSSRTSYAIVADLSEMELKKILIKKMEGNKSIQRSDAQRNLYKALVDAYESDKILLDTYGETVTLKRRRDDDEDKDEEPSAGPDRDAEKPQKPPTLDCDWNKTLPAVHGSIQPWISELAKQADSRSSFNELLDTPLDFSNFIMNRLKVDTLTLELLAGPTYELMKGSCKSLIELEYHLEEEPIDYDKHALWGVSHWGHKRQQFYGFAVNRESALDVYSKWMIIAVTDLKIMEWHSYKHLDWIMVRRDDDKLYKFKEGDFKRLRLQDIEDMLLLLVQGKLTNLTVEERFTFNVSLRMFTRSIVIQRRVEDLQLGVESYQKSLNLTKPDTYRSDLKRRKAYTAYSNPRGFIYQNKDKKNRLMRIDELHKFSDGTLNDVRTALDDRLKGIRMQYLLQTI
nr:hypothetical protein [Tanacetum cinerariifolium]